ADGEPGAAARVPAGAAGAVEPAPPAARGGAFRQGLLNNLLNPKIALLFLTLLPQFVAPGEPRLRTSAVLAGVFLGLALVWWWVFSLAVSRVAGLLRAPRVSRALDAAAGAALVGLAVRVAAES
ncbi:LysE family transporter, partial [Streptomyces sp. B1866]|uniref:LysE family translocator n=1 Tax=Streptomyces sp. B1866 TaxID=3075431 RepID=UPI00288EA197